MNDETVFTAYIRALQSGEGPATPLYEAALAKLRRLLAAELRRRSLWTAPPSYLGIYGFERWSNREAFDELLADSFEVLFLERLKGLVALVINDKAQIDSLCLRNLRYFLHERQKKHNPLGYRVFTILRQAVRDLVKAGRLHVLAGDPRIRNTTVLGFAPETDAEIGSVDLNEQVETWLNDLLPDLVTAPPSQLGETTKRLNYGITGLAARNVTAFCFKDLAGPLKSGVQKWRNAVWELELETTQGEGDKGFVSIVRQVRPGSAYEERQFFDKLVECVSEALPRAVKTKKTGAQLEKYWAFLRCQVAEDRADELPSRRKIGELLGIQRYQIPEFHQILGRELERCRKVCGQSKDRRETA